MATAIQPGVMPTPPEGCILLPDGNGFYRESDHTYLTLALKERPSVTQVLGSVGLSDYSHVREEVLEHKRELGTAVHYACHILARGDELDWDSVHEVCVPYVLAFEKWVKDVGFVVDRTPAGKAMTEMGGVFKLNGMEFGYHFDLRGTFGTNGYRWPALVEIKCTYREEKSWKIQTAAYELTQGKHSSGEPWKRIGLQLKPDGTFRMCGPYDSPRDRDVFSYALFLTHWKINEGIKWREDPKMRSG